MVVGLWCLRCVLLVCGWYLDLLEVVFDVECVVALLVLIGFGWLRCLLRCVGICCLPVGLNVMFA